jgi:hypothetical protein
MTPETIAHALRILDEQRRAPRTPTNGQTEYYLGMKNMFELCLTEYYTAPVAVVVVNGRHTIEKIREEEGGSE